MPDIFANSSQYISWLDLRKISLLFQMFYAINSPWRISVLSLMSPNDIPIKYYDNSLNERESTFISLSIYPYFPSLYYRLKKDTNIHTHRKNILSPLPVNNMLDLSERIKTVMRSNAKRFLLNSTLQITRKIQYNIIHHN